MSLNCLKCSKSLSLYRNFLQNARGAPSRSLQSCHTILNSTLKTFKYPKSLLIIKNLKSQVSEIDSVREIQ